jgi:hypothetical protein
VNVEPQSGNGHVKSASAFRLDADAACAAVVVTTGVCVCAAICIALSEDSDFTLVCDRLLSIVRFNWFSPTGCLGPSVSIGTPSEEGVIAFELANGSAIMADAPTVLIGEEAHRIISTDPACGSFPIKILLNNA